MKLRKQIRGYEGLYEVRSDGAIISMPRESGNYIETWANAYEVQEKLGINHGNINSCINKHRKTAGGYRWEALCA